MPLACILNTIAYIYAAYALQACILHDQVKQAILNPTDLLRYSTTNLVSEELHECYVLMKDKGDSGRLDGVLLSARLGRSSLEENTTCRNSSDSSGVVCMLHRLYPFQSPFEELSRHVSS